MHIGKIVSGGSHVECICQVFGIGESERTPDQTDYGFGTFVGIECPDVGLLVGVIANTILMNPEFGNLGPRLSTRDELAVFSPDYLAERVTLVEVVILGFIDRDGVVLQGVPTLAPQLDARVRVLERDEVLSFHQPDGELRVGYFPVITGAPNRLTTHLLRGIIAELHGLFPQQSKSLDILDHNLDWELRVRPAGQGAR